MSRLLLAYYGDDFTGSTDALECLATSGVPTMLFIDPPTREQLAKYPDLQAVGIAGNTRSKPTQALDEELRIAFPKLRDLRARHVHYKVCSTFDSSAEVGSIGRAIEVGCDVFGPAFVPLVVGAPGLGRYCVFGNLFARMGIGSDGAIHRLDRHPATRNHPITPANESDLRLYLGRQTNLDVQLFDVLMHELPEVDASKQLAQLVEGKPIVLFDVLFQQHLKRIGSLIDARASHDPLFSVGSSAVETALADHWHAEGNLTEAPPWPHLEEVKPVLVLSGSCSPVTDAQIEWALAHGFREVCLDTSQLVRSKRAVESAGSETIELLSHGENVIVHTGRGPNDKRLEATRHVVAEQIGVDSDVLVETNMRLSTILGQIGMRCLEAIQVRRVCVAGGDTSSYVARSLQIEALEMVAPLWPGAPLCRASARGPANGVEFNFKGGQVGDEKYFATVGRGTP